MTHSSTIDWPLVRQRIEASERGLREAMHPSEEAIQRIWQERARRLATRGLETTKASDDTPILVCRLKSQRYGMELRYVRAVKAMPSVTPIPGSAHEILGVIADHGDVHTVIEFARLLGIEVQEDPCHGILIHLRGDGLEAYLRVEAVDEILQVPRASLDSSRNLIERLRSPYFCGVQPDGLVLLNMKAILEACAGPTVASHRQPAIESSELIVDDLPQSDQLHREVEP